MGWEVPRRLPRNGWRMEKKIGRSGSARQSGGHEIREAWRRGGAQLSEGVGFGTEARTRDWDAEGGDEESREGAEACTRDWGRRGLWRRAEPWEGEATGADGFTTRFFLHFILFSSTRIISVRCYGQSKISSFISFSKIFVH
jgi:hypothetical protein